MIQSLLYIVFAFLIIASIIDWKVRVLPSIFLTAMIFTVAVLLPQNLWFGVMAFIVSYLLYESEFFSGIADIKIMSMLGFMVSTTNYLFLLIILTVVFGFIWKVFIKWRLPKEKDCAFIPTFVFVFIALYLLGGFA